MEILKTQELKIKVPLRRVEIPSKQNVHKKNLLIHSSPDTILINTLCLRRLKMQSKGVILRSDTSGNPIFQKVLQN